jgi:hypothetical protein
MRLISALLLVFSASLALDATAQTRIFCCDDASGRKVCGDFLPPACHGRAYEERNNRGFVSKVVEAPLTEDQLARREAEKAKKEQEAKKAGEERRRTLALLSTYSSEKDINSARDRSLAEVDKNMKESQQRLDEAKKKKLKLDSDKEFYKGKALPDPVKAQIRDNDKEIKAQQAAVDARAKEMAEVRGRFEEEKKRYLELTGKKASEAAPAAVPSAAPASAPAAAPVAAKPVEKK